MKRLLVLLGVSLILNSPFALGVTEHRNEQGAEDSAAAQAPVESVYSSAAVTLIKPKPKEEAKKEAKDSTKEAKPEEKVKAKSEAKAAPKKEAVPVETVSARKSILEDVKSPTDSVAADRKLASTGSSDSSEKKKTEYTNTTKLELPCYKEVKKQDGTLDLVKMRGDGIDKFTNASRSPASPKTPDQMLTGSVKNPITAREAKVPGMDVIYNVASFTIPLGKKGETRDYYNTAADDAESRGAILTGRKALTEAGFVKQDGLLCFTSGGGGGGGGQGGLGKN